MQNKKLSGLFFFVLTSMCILTWGNYLLFAKEETHKHSEKALAPEHKIIEKELPVCPYCKEVRVSPEKGRTLAAKEMVCPHCKNEISEVTVHRCDRCGKEVLACVLCQTASAELKVATAETECPKCKRVRVRPIKGKTLARWEIQCPDCKEVSQEWLIQHCDECGTDFLVCPICTKDQERSTINTAIDPVCGMEVQKNTLFKVDHEGKTYYLCSKKCEETFKKDPSRYPVE